MLAAILALVMGIVAGSRSMLAPAAVSWAAYLGWLNVEGSWVAFLAHPVAPWILTVAAIGELIADQLPFIPSRTTPGPFAGRILSGALCGAAIGTSAGAFPGGVIGGVVGAVIGTLGGRRARGKLAESFGQDRPAALLEDVVALALAIVVVWLAKV